MTTRETFQVLADFNDEYLEFAPYVEAFNEMDWIVNQFRQTGVAQHITVLGESGSGKTTLCKNFARRYPAFSLPHVDIVRVLHVTIPAVATLKSMASEILKAIGDPGFDRGDIVEKTKRIAKLVRTMKVEILLLDEAQHLQDRGQHYTQYMVADWLKNLVEEISVPTVLLGLPRTERLLQVNEQLRRRFSRRRDLQLSDNTDNPIHIQCLQMYLSFSLGTHLRRSNGAYGDDELGQRLYYASDARIGYLKKLLAGAIRLAQERSLEQIDPAVLEETFTIEIWWEGIGQLNPFNKDFVFRKLNRPNEPFETAAPSRTRS
jgi:DNA transposition AAA+ family ATPase